MKLIDLDKLRKTILELPNCPNGFSDTYDKAFILSILDDQPIISVKKIKEHIHED